MKSHAIVLSLCGVFLLLSSVMGLAAAPAYAQDGGHTLFLPSLLLPDGDGLAVSAAGDPRVHVLHRAGKAGLEWSIRARSEARSARRVEGTDQPASVTTYTRPLAAAGRSFHCSQYRRAGSERPASATWQTMTSGATLTMASMCVRRHRVWPGMSSPALTPPATRIRSTAKLSAPAATGRSVPMTNSTRGRGR